MEDVELPTIEVKDISPCKKGLVIEVSFDIYSEEENKIFKRLGNEVNVPGFRKGKIPIQIIKRKYGPKVKEEAINQSIPKAYSEAIKELGLTPVGTPTIDDVEVDGEKPIRFSATVEHIPSIELKHYKDFKFDWEITKSTDEDIDLEITRIKEAYSELESVSGRCAEKGDYVIIDFEGFINGNPIERGVGKGVQVCLGSGGFLPDLEAGIVGMSLGDKKEIETVFPENYQSKQFAGKKAVFKVILNEIKIKTSPELTDSFVKEHFKEESLEAFKGTIRKELEKREEEKAKLILRDKFFLKIFEENRFDFPESLVESQARMMTYNGMRQMGFTEERVKREKEQFQKLKEAMLPTARTSVLSQLIMERLKEIEKFEVSEEDLKVALKGSLGGLGQAPPMSTHRGEEDGLEKGGEHMDHLRAQIIHDKIFDFLVSNNQVEKVYIDRPKNISDNENNSVACPQPK